MSTLEIKTVDQAIEVIFNAINDDKIYNDIDSIILGHWSSTYIRLPKGFHSEIPSPFLDAYYEMQKEIYRFVALIESGNADIRGLSQQNVDKFLLKIKVEEGSSIFGDNLPEIIKGIVPHLVSKMSGTQVVIVVLGVTLLGCSTYGASVYMENRKEVQIAELQSSERTKMLEALNFASKTVVAQAENIRIALEQNGEIAQRALILADRTQEELLKAAAQTNKTTIGENTITRAEAKALTAASRRRTSERIVEQEMKIVDINTSDPLHTVVVIEDPESENQFKVSFSDRLVEEKGRVRVFSALEARGTIWLRLREKYSGDEVISYEIVRVIDPPQSEN